MTASPILPIPEERRTKQLRLVLEQGYVYQALDVNDRGTTLVLVLKQGRDVFDWKTFRMAMSAARKRVRAPKPKKKAADDTPAAQVG